MITKTPDNKLLGLNWIHDRKWDRFFRTNDPNIVVNDNDMSFLQEGRCPGCGESLNQIVQNNNVAAFDTILTIGVNKEITAHNRPKAQEYSCAKCGKHLHFLKTEEDLRSFVHSF